MLGIEERRALYVPLEDKPWAYICPSPTWDSKTGTFVGYRVGLYDKKYNLKNFEERLFPITKDGKDGDGNVIQVIDFDAWMEFVFPIAEIENTISLEEWEERRDRVIRLLNERE